MLYNQNIVNDNRENLNEIRENLFKDRENEAQVLRDSVKVFKDEFIKASLNNKKTIESHKEKLPFAKNEFLDKYINRIEELEQKNDKIMTRLNEFEFEGKCKWVSFKNEYRHDMAELIKSIKDFSIEKEDLKRVIM